jgi:hypothetical protein
MPAVRINLLSSQVPGSSAEPMENASVAFSYFHEPIPGKGEQLLPIDANTTNGGGNAFLNLPAGIYQVNVSGLNTVEDQIRAKDDDVNAAACGTAVSPATYGCNGYKEANIPTLDTVFNIENPEDGELVVPKQAARVNFRVHIDNGGDDTMVLTDAEIRIYATNEDGMPDNRVGNNGQLAVLDYVQDSGIGQLLGTSFLGSVELFPGNYRAIATGHATVTKDNPDYDTDVTDTDGYGDTDTDTDNGLPPTIIEEVIVHPYVTDVIAIGEDEPEVIAIQLPLNQTKNFVNLTLKNEANDNITARSVTVYDCETGWVVNSGNTALDAETNPGRTNIPAGNFSDVVAVTTMSAGSGAGGFHFKDLATSGPQTIKEVYLNGYIGPDSAVVDAPIATSVTLTQVFDNCNINIAAGRTIYPINDGSSDHGEFNPDAELFWGWQASGSNIGAEYSVTAQDLYGYFLTQSITKIVTDADNQKLEIDAENGGIISGAVTRKTGGGVKQGVLVMAEGTDGTGFAGYDITNMDGEYEIPVPEGTYTLWVGGARTEGITVASGETTVRDFLFGQYNGQVQNAENVEVDNATWYINSPAPSGVVSDGGGNYTLEFYEGISWACINPHTSDDGDNLEFKCFYEMPITGDDME